MDLKLRQLEQYAVLEISGDISAHNLQVLKAGIKKLFHSGKNKIILSLIDATSVEGEVIRELAMLDILARELSGKIVLVSDNDELKDQVKSFAAPPVIPIFSTIEQAVDYLSKLSDDPEDEESVDELKRQLEVKNKEIKALEARVSMLDPREIKMLKEINADMKAKLKTLEKQVDDLQKRKVNPPDEAGLLEKITALEKSIKQMGPTVETGK